jgi:CheY-like chemotaxis protein
LRPSFEHHRPGANWTYPILPIIALTAGAFDEDRASSLKAGMNDYLSKPFKLDQLADTLSIWLGQAPA